MDNTALTARDVIEAVLDNMVEGLEPLVTKTLAPSLYEVRLHAEDLERFRGILDQIESEARALLDAELERRNRPSALSRWLGKRHRPMRYERAEDDWYLSFQEDPNGTLEPGAIEVVSELAAEPSSAQSDGTRTRLISTTRRGGRSTTRKVETDAKTVYARISYRDDQGKQLFQMTKRQIVIGRGAADAWTDLRLHTKHDVSRQHARIKYQPDAGRFLIKDLSTYGTSLDGDRIAPSVEVVDGAERDADRWVEMPAVTRIGLADVIALDFEAVVELAGATLERDGLSGTS